MRELYRGDCLDILEDYIEPNSIDLIYLDPPFNSKSTYNLPFKNKDRSYKPVDAFVDTWTWTADDDIHLAEMEKSFKPDLQLLAQIVRFARADERGRKSSSASYLLNMGLRLRMMRRVLKPTGSIYLHCDPTASHYLKLIMDTVFGKNNFRNEIIWGYRTGGVSKRWFGRKHDILLFFTKSDSYPFNLQKERSYNRGGKPYRFRNVTEYQDEEGHWYTMATMRDIWEINAIGRTSRERLGYPTQKPLALLERVVKASSPENGIVLDPFCGCGTTVHAAEQLGRQWIGIDISRFSTELMRERILHNFPQVQDSDIRTLGLPESIADAKSLARENPFEFEKWVCGRIGANGMGIRKAPGDRGADGGIDGVIELALIHGRKVDKAYVIVQVKGGKVTPDAVKALSETVRRLDAVAGVMVCFEDQMNTVENQRSREVWSDDTGTYPFIQGYSVGDLLQDKRLNLPSRYGRKRGGRMSALI